MITDLKRVHNLETMLDYFSTNLGWNIDIDDFDIENLTFEFLPDDLNLTEESFSKITSVRQLRPLVENQPWGIFAIEFDSNRFEVSALRKVLSGLIPKRRNTEHAV